MRKGRARGRHRRRREPRPCFGELLHLDGSRHAWLRLCPAEQNTLIAVLDDASKRLLYAQLWAAETTEAVMTALRAVFAAHGLPVALYTDRAGWAFHTPQAGGRVDRTRLNQIGRALAQLGIEHIASYSPQGRGRSERLNRTVQGRLINELALAGVRTRAVANAYLTARFIAAYNEEFAHTPADPTSAFVPLHGADLDAILCHIDERSVGQDNVVVLDDVVLQLPKQPGRRSCAGLRRDRPPGSARRPLGVAWHPVLGPLRPGGPAARGHRGGPPEKRARAFGSGATIRAAARPLLPPCAPENPTASRPTSPDRSSAVSGQITCQNRADRSLVTNSAREAR